MVKAKHDYHRSLSDNTCFDKYRASRREAIQVIWIVKSKVYDDLSRRAGTKNGEKEIQNC